MNTTNMKRDLPLSNASVSVRDVHKSFNGATALHDINLDVQQGSFVSLLGPSGCGKSTLLNLIAGFLTPDHGTVSINGKDVSRVPPQSRNLGFLFQDYALFPHLTVSENIAYPLVARKESKRDVSAKVEAVLKRIDLKSYADRYPATLSGGQRQRVALARATVFTPPVLLLDEPLGALDRRMRDAMQTQFKQWHNELKTTFVYVTHDQDEAMSMSDIVVMMDRSRIVQIGTPEEIYTRPRTEFVARFLGDCNLLDPGAVMAHLPNDHISLTAYGWARGCDPSRTLVAVRPEHVSIASEAAADGRVFSIPARIEQIRYFGNHSIVHLSSVAGDLIARVPQPPSSIDASQFSHAVITAAHATVVNRDR